MKSFFEVLKEFKELKIEDSLNFELINEIIISHHSTAIEGSTLTEEETRLLITDGITTKGKPLYDHNMVKDHQDALVWIVEQAKLKREITPSFIQEISSKVMKTTGGIINAAAGSYDSSKGEWRKSAVSVGARYFTNYLKVEREVSNLCTNINAKINTVNSEKDIYNLAFDSHFYLVSIHPFADGNGRTARLLMNAILTLKEQPMAIIFKEDKADYYKALEDSRKEGADLTPIREFMYSQQEKFLLQEIEKFKKQDIDLDIKL